VTGLGWMADGTCVGSGLSWTAEPGTYPAVLAAVMADACAACPVLDRCSDYAADHATAGFWAGSWRIHPGEPLQPELPLDDIADAAA
jgi:hypothetical protein